MLPFTVIGVIVAMAVVLPFVTRARRAQSTDARTRV
jgi:hypothetical protein